MSQEEEDRETNGKLCDQQDRILDNWTSNSFEELLDMVLEAFCQKKMLGEKISYAFPNGNIIQAVVCMTGNESTGKSSLVARILYNNPTILKSLSRENSRKLRVLMKIHETGSTMTTRRPIIIRLEHVKDAKADVIFRFKDEELCTVEAMEQWVEDHKIAAGVTICFKEPLTVVLRGQGLTNQTFIDLPGFRSENINCADDPSTSLWQLTIDRIADSSTIIVAVENINGFNESSSSRILPHLKEHKAFSRSIIAFTKVDQVKRAAFQKEYRHLFVENETNQHQFRRVGICNQICDQDTVDPHTATLEEWQAYVVRVGEFEINQFEKEFEVKDRKMFSINSLLQHMSELEIAKTHESTSKAYENMNLVIDKKLLEIRKQLAPPVWMYFEPAPTVEIFRSEVMSQFGTALTTAFRSCVEKLVPYSVTGVEAFKLIGFDKPWPPAMLGNIDADLKIEDAFNEICMRFRGLVANLLDAARDLLFIGEGGIFAACNYECHRLDRFDIFCDHLRSNMCVEMDKWGEIIIEKFDDLCKHFWDANCHTNFMNESQIRQHVKRVFQSIRCTFCRLTAQSLNKVVRDVNWEQPRLLEENVNFGELRHKLLLEFEQLHIQRTHMENYIKLGPQAKMVDIDEVLLKAARELYNCTKYDEQWEFKIWRRNDVSKKEKQDSEPAQFEKTPSKSQNGDSPQVDEETLTDLESSTPENTPANHANSVDISSTQAEETEIATANSPDQVTNPQPPGFMSYFPNLQKLQFVAAIISK